MQSLQVPNYTCMAKIHNFFNLSVLMQDGVVLGADTRATSDEVVADKMCAKIHYIAPNI